MYWFSTIRFAIGVKLGLIFLKIGIRFSTIRFAIGVKPQNEKTAYKCGFNFLLIMK